MQRFASLRNYHTWFDIRLYQGIAESLCIKWRKERMEAP